MEPPPTGASLKMRTSGAAALAGIPRAHVSVSIIELACNPTQLLRGKIGKLLAKSAYPA